MEGKEREGGGEGKADGKGGKEKDGKEGKEKDGKERKEEVRSSGWGGEEGIL